LLTKKKGAKHRFLTGSAGHWERRPPAVGFWVDGLLGNWRRGRRPLGASASGRRFMRTIRWYSAIACYRNFYWNSTSYVFLYFLWNSLNPP